MDAKGIIDVVVNNSPYLLIILSAAVIFLFTMVISQSLRLSRMQKRYKKMMTGVEVMKSATIQKSSLTLCFTLWAIRFSTPKLFKKRYPL